MSAGYGEPGLRSLDYIHTSYRGRALFFFPKVKAESPRNSSSAQQQLLRTSRLSRSSKATAVMDDTMVPWLATPRLGDGSPAYRGLCRASASGVDHRPRSPGPAMHRGSCSSWVVGYLYHGRNGDHATTRRRQGRRCGPGANSCSRRHEFARSQARRMSIYILLPLHCVRRPFTACDALSFLVVIHPPLSARSGMVCLGRARI